MNVHGATIIVISNRSSRLLQKRSLFEKSSENSSSGGCGRTFFSHFRGGSSAYLPRIRPGPRQTASEQILSAESAVDSASEIFIPPKMFLADPRRRQSDPLGPTRTQTDLIGVRRGIVPPPRLPLNKINVQF